MPVAGGSAQRSEAEGGLTVIGCGYLAGIAPSGAATVFFFPDSQQLTAVIVILIGLSAYFYYLSTNDVNQHYAQVECAFQQKAVCQNDDKNVLLLASKMLLVFRIGARCA